MKHVNMHLYKLKFVSGQSFPPPQLCINEQQDVKKQTGKTSQFERFSHTTIKRRSDFSLTWDVKCNILHVCIRNNDDDGNKRVPNHRNKPGISAVWY